MARIRAFGVEFRANILEDLGDGTFIAECLEATPRSAPGTKIRVNKKEILEMGVIEALADPHAGVSEIEKQMAAERQGLPTAAELLSNFRENQGVSVPKDPTPPQQGRQTRAQP